MSTTMTTLSGVLEKLRIKKQDNEFIMTAEGFTSPAGKLYKVDELTIIKTYRFEGNSDPSDSSILYLIESKIRNRSLQSTQVLGINKYSLEHLMPKKWENHWGKLSNQEDRIKRNRKLLTLG